MMPWPWGMKCRLRWRKSFQLLLLLTITSSVFVNFWPSSIPIGSIAPMGHRSNTSYGKFPQKRRIQEASRKLGPPTTTLTKDKDHTDNDSQEDIIDPPPLKYHERLRRRHKDKVVFVNNYTLPFLQLPNTVAHRNSNKSAVAQNVEERALMAVVALKEQGAQLTQQQKNILQRVDHKTMQDMKERLSIIRQQREEIYFSLLRKRSQIQRLPSGGERVIASPMSPIRFPASLKKIRPEYWTGTYRTYLNMTYFPWPKIPSCSEFSTTFAPPGSLKMMALASFPSSGNTWVRYLLESGSGIFTGSIYEDSSFIRKGLYGEGVIYDSGMTIVQKTHGYTTGSYMKLPHEERVTKNHMYDFNNQGMMIIRNPFKALISHRHLDVGGHTGYAPRSHFVGQGWKEFVLLKIKLWKEFYMDWLEAARPQDLYVIFYEELLSDPMSVLRRILKFLHLPIDTRRQDCLSKHPDGMFKRKPTKSFSMTANPFTAELKAEVYSAIDELSHALVQKGNKPLPIRDYEMYDEVEAMDVKRRRYKG